MRLTGFFSSPSTYHFQPYFSQCAIASSLLLNSTCKFDRGSPLKNKTELYIRLNFELIGLSQSVVFCKKRENRDFLQEKNFQSNDGKDYLNQHIFRKENLLKYFRKLYENLDENAKKMTDIFEKTNVFYEFLWKTTELLNVENVVKTFFFLLNLR